MSLSAFFSEIGAPLKNVRWSWGAQGKNGAVIFRAWEDEIEELDGKKFIRLANHKVYRGSTRNHGYNERLRHIQQLREGSAGYVVICVAKKPMPRARRIKSFERKLEKIRAIKIISGDEWAELE